MMERERLFSPAGPQGSSQSSMHDRMQAAPRGDAQRSARAEAGTEAGTGTGGSNIPEYSVGAISSAIKRVLEGTFGRVRIRGEITEMKRYASGHIYLSLKDEGGKIAGVIWRGSVSRLGMVPENGTEVIATGRISSYGERSSYQLIIDRMEFAGEGALLARIEALRVRLRDEGLFDSGRKKPIPFLPRYVGVVTSRSGAVLHDICTTISRRFPRNVLLWPVAVQGEGAARQIAHAVHAMGHLSRPPDVLIVARGGGSLEDLMAFNEEAVVRAVAECPVPVISAVGHETDTTLVDYASDRRAPTPTAAAEMAVPLRSEMLADLAHRTARLSSGLAGILQRQGLRLQAVVGRMPDLPGLLDTARMRLDDRAQRLELALPGFVMRARARLGENAYHLPAVETVLGKRHNIVEAQAGRLQSGWERFWQNCQMRLLRAPLRVESVQSRLSLQRTRLEGMARHLQAVSPLAILERGYVLVQDEAGRAVTSSAALPQGSHVQLSFADGRRQALLDPEGKEAPQPDNAAASSAGVADAGDGAQSCIGAGQVDTGKSGQQGKGQRKAVQKKVAGKKTVSKKTGPKRAGASQSAEHAGRGNNSGTACEATGPASRVSEGTAGSALSSERATDLEAARPEGGADSSANSHTFPADEPSQGDLGL